MNTCIEIKIHNPLLILKDRPYNMNFIEIDLGEMTVTSLESMVKGRFKKFPNKEALVMTFKIKAKNLGLKFQQEKKIVYNLTSPFGLFIDFTAISYSSVLPNIGSNELDKS